MAAAYTVVSSPAWGIVQQTPLSSINERLEDHTRKLLLYALPPFLLLLLLSVLLAQRLARPFTALANVARKISSGDTAVLLQFRSHWNREVDDLTKAVSIAMQTMQNSNNNLTRKAYTDPLTGLSNRAALNELLDKLSGDGNVYSVIILDIDRFKSVNDTYGHQVGDEVLKFLAALIRESVRLTDVCFRYGGEEFVILLPGTAAPEALEVAEALRHTTEMTVSPIGKPITISLGIAEFPIDSQKPDELFRLADQALYQSKNDGRNRATVASLQTRQSNLV